MSNIGIAMLLIIGLSVIVLIVLISVLMGKKGTKKLEVKEKAHTLSVYDLLELAENKNISKNDLTNVVLKFVKSFPIPPRVGKNIPSEAKPYFDLIFAVVYNRNSDAKLIAFMNKELRKQNPSYTHEIETQEEKALQKRKFEPQR